MAKRYSEAQKEKALACLSKHGGNVQAASVETGIAADTLRRWAQARKAGEEALLRLEQRVDTLRERTNGQHEQAAKDPLLRLREQLMENALVLVESLRDVVNDAPLSQRANALNQLLDKIIKLGDLLPEEANEETVIRHEYRYPDGSIHSAPPWAEDDSEE